VADGALDDQPQDVEPSAYGRGRRQERAAVWVAQRTLGPIPLHIAKHSMAVAGDGHGGRTVAAARMIVTFDGRPTDQTGGALVAGDVGMAALQCEGIRLYTVLTLRLPSS
jgi:hypothetical protein